jgi:threonine aldolase
MDEMSQLQAHCTRSIGGHGQFSAAHLLATIPAETELDRYGDGGVVAELEREIAGLLAKPAALVLPSGTMAQQAVLRVHADRRGRRTVVFHPACHIDQHEGRGYERLHGLTGRPVGEATGLLTLDQLTSVAEPVAALVLELPQRDLGGLQPDWADLVSQVGWARSRGAAAHLDGARLWESAAGYGVEPARVAELFDSVYVSFYKGLGALGGCAVAGEADVIAELAEWRRRHGGTLFGLWPFAASALTGLRGRLPLMPAYLEHARAIAQELSGLPGVTVLPDPPQTSMLHLLLPARAEKLAAVARRLAQQDRLWTWRTFFPTDDPNVQRVELTVGDATCTLTPAEVRDVIATLLAG